MATLRALPSVHQLLEAPQASAMVASHGRPLVRFAVQHVIEEERRTGAIAEPEARWSAIEQKMFFWALKVAEERLPYRVENKPMPLGLKLKSFLADKTVFKKILARLGGRVKFVLSGGAPLSPELASFFIGAGLLGIPALILCLLLARTTKSRAAPSASSTPVS